MEVQLLPAGEALAAHQTGEAQLVAGAARGDGLDHVAGADVVGDGDGDVEAANGGPDF